MTIAIEAGTVHNSVARFSDERARNSCTSCTLVAGAEARDQRKAVQNSFQPSRRPHDRKLYAPAVPL